MTLYHVSMDIETDLIRKNDLLDFLQWWLDCDMLNSVEDLEAIEI